jgi:hypothetical protein
MSDELLAKALSFEMAKHPTASIYHFDEFQPAVLQWMGVNPSSETSTAAVSCSGERQQEPAIQIINNVDKVKKITNCTIVGMQSALDGLSTPACGIFLMTSSRELPKLTDVADTTQRHEFVGLLRRFTSIVHLPDLNQEKVAEFFEKALPAICPGLDAADVKKHPSWLAFLQAWIPTDVRGEIGFGYDALSKYVHEVCFDFVASWGCEQVLQHDGPWPSGAIDAFLCAALSARAVSVFMDKYAAGQLKVSSA